MIKKDTPNGVIIYEGPSLIDGKPIVVIANSFKSNKNRKIGNMIQTYILRTDKHPNDCLKTGDDYSVCGDCIHRGVYAPDIDTVQNRTCYVNLYQQGIYSVYNAFKRGSYPVCEFKHMQLFKGRHVRLGSYGDPAAVPMYVWDTIIQNCHDYTGYTHSWKTCDPDLAKYCMASVENMDDAILANSMGYRTFRLVITPDDIQHRFEIPCPAQISDKVHCDKCTYCDGCNIKKRNVAVVFHGRPGTLKQYLSKIGA